MVYSDNLRATFIHETAWGNGYAIYFLIHDYDGKDYYGKPLEMTLEESPGVWREPSAVMSKKQTQELFNDLWMMGFRPESHEGVGRAMEAQKENLQDLRAILKKAEMM